jgi:hypothetical protein
VEKALLAGGALLAVLLLPATAAEMRFEDVALSNGTLVPETETDALEGVVVVDCSDVAAGGLQGAVIMFEAPTADRPGLYITGQLAYAVDPMDCVGATEVRVPFTFEVAATRQAPGETEIKISLEASLQAGVDTVPVAPAQGSVALVVEPFFLCRVESDRSVAGPGSGPANFTVTVLNLGNVRTNVNPQTTWADGADTRPTSPPPFVLESATQGGNETGHTLTFEVPRDGGEAERELILNMTGASTKDPSKTGTCGELRFLVLPDQSFLGIPDPSVPMLVAALVAVAGMRRSRI